jgi:hypothetical protein
MKKAAEATRIVFYLLIPVCWLGTVIRRFDEESLMLLWLSPLLSLFFARKVKNLLIIKEAKLLTGLASLSLVALIGQLSLTSSIIVLLGFSSYYGLAYLLNRRNNADIYQFICSWGILTLGFALPIIIGEQSNNPLYGMMAASIYWAIAFNTLSLSEHLKRNERFITAVNIVLVIIAWGMMQSSVTYVLSPTIFLLATLYQKQHRFKHSQLSKAVKCNSDLLLHSMLAVTYVSLCYSIIEYRLELLISPLLAVHGAMILFLKDRQITTVKYSFVLILLGIIKLAIVDAANALLWQKVILFMGIGIFILLASFWYQKVINKAEAAHI